jgi:hypothetical protein
MFSASIPESELQERFRSLQKQLRDRWQTIDQFDQDDNDILVVLSIAARGGVGGCFREAIGVADVIDERDEEVLAVLCCFREEIWVGAIEF